MLVNFSVERHSDIVRIWAEICIKREDEIDISPKTSQAARIGTKNTCITGVGEGTAQVLVTMVKVRKDLRA